MFAACTSLVDAPDLSATILAPYCYRYMFYRCTSLKIAPILPAPTLLLGCYISMFEDCNSLADVTMLATTINDVHSLDNWLIRVSSNGMFTKSRQMTTLPDGANGIPYGWSILNAQ
jgi:hypothetical protein